MFKDWWYYLLAHSKSSHHQFCNFSSIVKIAGSTWRANRCKLCYWSQVKHASPKALIKTSFNYKTGPVVMWSLPNMSSSATLPPIQTSICASNWDLVSLHLSFSGSKDTCKIQKCGQVTINWRNTEIIWKILLFISKADIKAFMQESECSGPPPSLHTHQVIWRW